MSIITDRNDGKSGQDVAVTDVLATVFESGQVEAPCILWVENTGNYDVATANVEVSPDGVTWFSLDTATFKVAATVKALLKMEGYPYFRFQAACATGKNTTLDIGVTLYGN